jgi:hypothetical protein
VVASRRGYRPATAAAVAGPAPDTVDLALVLAVTGLAGTVRGPDGVPQHRATVTATDAQGDVAAVVVTDAAGAYAMPGLEPGRYTVVATSHIFPPRPTWSWRTARSPASTWSWARRRLVRATRHPRRAEP